MNQYDIIVKKLTEKIAKISEESAIYYSLYVKEKEEKENLQQQLNELQGKDE